MCGFLSNTWQYHSDYVIMNSVFLGNLVQYWGSSHEHWNRIHWIRISDPDSIWSHVSSTQHADYAHCTAGLDFTHCHASSISRSSDPDRDHVEAKCSLDADWRSASDPDPRSRVESPIKKNINMVVIAATCW